MTPQNSNCFIRLGTEEAFSFRLKSMCGSEEDEATYVALFNRENNILNYCK